VRRRSEKSASRSLYSTCGDSRESGLGSFVMTHTRCRLC
jgi:hypothetical protein